MKTGMFVAILATLALIAGNLAEESEFEAWSKDSLQSYDHLSLEEDSAPTPRAASSEGPDEFQDVIMSFEDDSKQRHFSGESILSGTDRWEAQREAKALAKAQRQLEDDGDDVETEVLLQAPGTAFVQASNPELLTVTVVKGTKHPHSGISTSVKGDCEKLVKGLDTAHVLQDHPECTRWMISIDNTGATRRTAPKARGTATPHHGGTRKSAAAADETSSAPPTTELVEAARGDDDEIVMPLFDQEQRLYSTMIRV